METIQKISPKVFEQDKGKDKHFPAIVGHSNTDKAMKLNPVFDDLNNPETILNHVEKLKQTTAKEKENIGLFTVKPANRWIEQAKGRPIPKMLFSEFWFEGELCILFADTNLGKSILAVQIGNSISRGNHIQNFKMEAQKQPILYFDFLRSLNVVTRSFSKASISSPNCFIEKSATTR